MTKIRTWQLCRTGTFGSDGATITDKDLNELMETFTPTRPISVGHDRAKDDGFPKFGDVLALDGIYPDPKHPGEKVLVGYVRLHPSLDSQFDDGDGNGTYNGWSVTIPRRASDGKRYLHSLAVLGMTPPKIPGLEQLSNGYSDGDKIEAVEFSDKLDFQEETMTEAEKKKMEDLEKKNQELEQKLKEAEVKKNSQKDDKAAYGDKADEEIKSRLEATEKELKKNKLERFSDAIANKVPQGVLEKAKAVAEVLVDVSDVNFSDNGENKSAPALNLLQDVLAAWPQTAEEGQLYSFSDGSDDKDEPNKNGNAWAKIANKL